MKIKLKALLGSMALAMALAQPVTAMSADLVEYYDNGYLTGKSVEALRIEQKRVKAILSMNMPFQLHQWKNGTKRL